MKAAVDLAVAEAAPTLQWAHGLLGDPLKVVVNRVTRINRGLSHEGRSQGAWFSDVLKCTDADLKGVRHDRGEA